jgi:type I restriction enzyme S subunit
VAEMSVSEGFQQTEVGVIPQDWDVTELWQLADFLDGQRKPIKSSDREKMKGIYPYYGASGIIDYVNNYIFDDELILLGEDGENILSRNLRLAFIVRGKVWVNNHAHVLKAKEGCSTEFLAEKLESLNYEQYNSGTAQPKITKGTCAKIKISIPPTKAEQTAIAAALSDMDALIDGVEKLLEKKRRIKQGAMQELLRPKEGWKEVQLDSVADIDNDNLSSSSDPNFTFQYISLEDVDNGLLKGTTEMMFKDAPSRARRRVKQGDVLISTVRPNLKSHLIIKENLKNYICSTGFSLIRCDKGKLTPGYLFNHLFASFINQQIDSVISGSNYPAINTSHVKSLKIPIPTRIKEQEEIAAILSDMDSEIEQLETQLTKYRKLKIGMMQELLTGKKRLV